MVDLLHVVPFLSPFALFDPDDGLFEAATDMIEILSSLGVMSCRTGLTSQRTANRFRRLQICEYFLAAHVCAFLSLEFIYCSSGRRSLGFAVCRFS